LIEILTHTTSLRFGTFLMNSDKERRDKGIPENTISLWTYINSNVERFLNPLYETSSVDLSMISDELSDSVLHPCVHASAIQLWEGYYLRFSDDQLRFKARQREEKRLTMQLRQENESLRRQLELARASASSTLTTSTSSTSSTKSSGRR
jgi:myotubularin-related protein 1/2